MADVAGYNLTKGSVVAVTLSIIAKIFLELNSLGYYQPQTTNFNYFKVIRVL